jgi:hypothetical protein
MRILWTDEDMLTALHLRDHLGMDYTAIGARFGRTKSAIAGLMKRIDDETNKADVTPHLNGTMKPMWWKR